MARVNHKLVMQRLNEKRSKITDRQFFSSRILAGHFEDIAAAQTRRYNYDRRIHVNLYWKTKCKEVAVTDNQYIRINCGNKMVTRVRGRENRYHLVCGLFAHELGHVLYTDFLAAKTHHNYLARYHWYPVPPDLKQPDDAKNEKALWEYVKAEPRNLEMVQMISHFISNVLEDGYIENRMLLNFPGTLGYGLESLRAADFEDIPTVTQLIESEENGTMHIFESILQIMLSYAKYGEIKYGDEPLNDERIRIVFSLIHEIDSALLSHSGKQRLEAVNTILVRCWTHIEDFSEMCKQRQDDAVSAGDNTTLEDILKETLGSVAGISEQCEGSTAPVTEALSETNESVTEKMREKTHADADTSAGSAEGSSQTDTENENSGSGSGEDMLLSDSSGKQGKQTASEHENGRITSRQSEEISVPTGGSVEKNDAYEREKYEDAAADIARVLDKMAEKAACEELENERIRELNDVAQSISYGDIHSGVAIRVNRIASVDEELVEQYQQVSGPLLTISKQLQRSLIKQLQEYRRGGKQTGLLMGRRLDTHALCRNDGRVFYKNALPNEMPELTVGLLLDESGSMSSCDRCTYARASAIILYDFCQSLGIPVMVYGHSTGCDNVELYSYAEFDGFDNDDKYRMMDIGARGSNRDGAALRFVADQLSKRPETVKLLILVSDGQPADSGYYGTAAEEDLRGIKHEYQRKGIIFVAAAIGDDKENIERIYGDSFLDITDLNQLPAKLTAVVKRHIRV